jgi:hypothetical protein
MADRQRRSLRRPVWQACGKFAATSRNPQRRPRGGVLSRPLPAPQTIDWSLLTPASRETATLIAMRLTAGLTLDEIAVELERDRSRIKRNRLPQNGVITKSWVSARLRDLKRSIEESRASPPRSTSAQSATASRRPRRRSGSSRRAPACGCFRNLRPIAWTSTGGSYATSSGQATT